MMKRIDMILLLAMALNGVIYVSAQERHDDHEAHEVPAHDEATHHEATHDDHEEHGISAHDEAARDEAAHDDEAEAGVVELSAESIRVAGIQVTALTPELLPEFISAPGEIRLDQYNSADVTSLIDAVVIKRHARLGDEVGVGQPLVTLASVEVAAAQGELMIKSADWQRVRRLGKEAVSAKRYVEAEVAYEQARLELIVYGLDDRQVDAIAGGDLEGTLGEFNLNAPLNGTVVRDDFRVGQHIEAGQSLFLVADESRVWVEASLPPLQADKIEIGMPAEIDTGEDWHTHTGTVIQKHHILDEQTRTIAVRISLEPSDRHYHPGEFVQVTIALQSAATEPSLVVPEAALMQDDEGNWTVFVEIEHGHFKRTRVVRGAAHAGKIPISGIAEGTSVVTAGAFYLAAELAKSGFDIHAH